MLSCRHAALARAVGARREPAAAQQRAPAACSASAGVGCAFALRVAFPCEACAHACAAQESISDLRQYSLTEEELVRPRALRERVFGAEREAGSLDVTLRLTHAASRVSARVSGFASRAPHAQPDRGVAARCAPRGVAWRRVALRASCRALRSKAQGV